ncbi:peptidoglycan/LPS O-acetylase OafA/YrhL [Frondihabitans sp. PhB188]|uniref:acyltransferase family protein n=1 Tax=Frondihabitans sp. PhB188 TaxID=2485200 RepID=UPI000FC106FD|nr:acyltransferase family protein [Frondihabitans sp. PhB188]ROQ38347.1 peptidoglycan/LPS O-acetylase OafA/YrhL [Frondihabitans sp. PhB188]
MTAPTVLRADIQGLRAVAVGAVVLDHTVAWPSGGFLGVDVFFVISGFLITGLLIREAERSGRIDFRAFYVRRVKRILPLAVVVLAATVVAARLTVNAARAGQIGVDALWAAAFGANVRFERAGTDYFQSQGPVSPLQHFWSLSVEEQFYFVWPAVIAVVLVATRRASDRARRLALGGVLGAGVAASFVVAVVVTAANPTSAYFSTATRSWELGAGALLAVMAPTLAGLPGAARTVLCWSGLAGIGASLFLLDDSFPLPGPWALAPVLATAAVIASGTGSTGSSQPWCPLLSNPLAQRLGTLSYALYLWHFPVVILGATLLPDAPWAPAVLIAFSVVLSAASHALIEMPALRSPWPTTGLSPERRRRRWSAWRAEVGPGVRRAGLGVLVGATTLGLAAALLPGESPVAPVLPPAAAAAGAVTPNPSATADAAAEATAGPAVAALQTEIRAALAANSWPALDPSLDSVLDGSREGSDVLRCGEADERRIPQEECTWGAADAESTAVLVGDSTAMHYLDSLVGVATSENSGLRLQNRAMFACPFVAVPIRNDTAGILARCAQHNSETVEFLRQSKPDLVIVTNSYQELTDDDTGAPVTAERWSGGLAEHLGAIPDESKIALLAPPPDEADIVACYTPRSTPANCLTRTQKTWFTRFDSDSTVIEKRTGVVVDPRPMLCASDLCPAFIGTAPVKEDRVHLTTAFAKKIVPAVDELLREAGALPAKKGS